MKGFGKFIAKNKVLVLIIGVLLLVPSLYGMAMTRINYDILTYLPKNLDSTKGQKILDDVFSSGSTGMLVIENMESKDIVKIKDKISKIDGVERAIWVNDIVDTSVPKEILPDAIKNAFYEKNSTLIMIKFKEVSSTERTQNAISQIRGVLNKQCFLSGVSAIVKDTKDLADKETPIYVALAVFLCLVVLLLSLESFVTPFIFIASIGFAVIYNFGTNIFLGEISYVSKSIAAVLQLAVTMDYSIFLLHRYEEEKRKTDDRVSAMAEAIAATFVSLSGSSLTTIAGFAALCVMKIGIGMDIGVVMAKGVLIGVLTTVTILPAFVLVFDRQIHKYQHRVYLPTFEKTADFVTKHYKLFIAIFLLAFLPALYGQSNTKVYYNLDESLPKNLDSVVALNKLKNDYSMMTTHMIIVNDNVPSYKIKEMVEKIEKVDGIENVLAYDKFVGPNIPESFVPKELKENFTKDGYRLIIANSKYKAASDEENIQIDRLNSIVKSYDNCGMVAGEGAMVKELIRLADIDFNNVNIVSIIAIFIIILLVFKSLSIPIILVASIELAIFINMGIPYYTGEVIPFIASIIIGTIQLGSTVDYAILLSSRFREELRKGFDKFTAMKITVKGSARSIVTSALAFFAATVGVKLIADMDIVKVMCGLLSRGALISAAVIIFILPSILLMFEGVIKSTSKNWREAK